MSKSTVVWIIVILFLVVLAVGYYDLFLKPRQPKVGLEFSKPSQVLVGEPFILTVSFSNYSEQILKNSSLSLILPDGVSFLEQSRDQRILEQAVGDIGPGSINQQDFNLIVLNGAQSLKHLQAELSYTVFTGSYSSAEFQDKTELDLAVGQPAISISFNSPQNALSGENFDLDINYQNNSNTDFKNMKLKIDYPSVFQFQRSSLAASSTDNSIWELGSLAKGASGNLIVTGNVVGPAQSFANFNAKISADIAGQSYDLNSQTANLMVSPSPLSLDVSLNGGGNYVANLGDRLTYTFHYKNNSPVPFKNIVLKAALVGQLFDLTSISTNGSFNPLSNTFTWLAANTPDLVSLDPGQEGSVALEIRVKGNFSIRRLSDKNYTLKINAQIESPTVPPNTSAPKTITLANTETKVAGKISLQAKALWRDASSGILNIGPYPPKVNQPTQYAIHWLLTNYATDVSNVQVSASLQSGARWTGVVKSNVDSQPIYDANSGKITWNINHLSATAGIISKQPEAVFQIEVTPAINQLNQNIIFLSQTNVQAQDDFTNSVLNNAAGPLDTSLPDDKTIFVSNRGVQQ